MRRDPFIAPELRPDLVALVEGTPAPEAGASDDELREIARGVFSDGRRAMLGLDDDEASFAGGVLVSRSPDVEISEVDDEAVLLKLSNGEYFGLNPVATAIWKLLVEPLSLDTIATAVSARYEVEPAKAREDAARMLARMREHELIRLESAA